MTTNNDGSQVLDGTQGSSPDNTSSAGAAAESEEQKKQRLADLDKEIEEKEKRKLGLVAEEQELFKSIHDKRAERRTLDSQLGEQTIADTKVQHQAAPPEPSTVQEAIAKAAEQRAIREFVKSHPEYLDDKKWQTLTSSYQSRRGKLLWEDIVEDLEDAHLVLNKDTIRQDAEEKAKAELAKKMFSSSQGDIGGSSTSAPPGTSKVLTDEEKKLLAKLQKVDPKMTEERFIKRKESLINS